jgi:hypothetical protein
MRKAMKVTTLTLAVLMAAPLAMAQDAPATSGGKITVGVLGRDDVESSKFTEYREVPKGVFVPYFKLFSKGEKLDFNLIGKNVRQDDQSYNGWLKTSSVDVYFDYNQTPHNMGNNGRTIMTEVSRGVWTMSDALQQSLGTANNATPTTGRNVTFYDSLLASSFASAGLVDVSKTRNRGSVAFDLGKKLPFDLTLTYMRELKSGYRGEDGGGIYSAVQSVVEVPGPLNEITQDIGVRAAYNFKKGNLHGSFSRNVYNNRAETLTIDNPFQWFDTPYLTSPAPATGGGTQARWINAPDNEASSGNLGFLLKFAKQTRLGGDVSMARWTQNAPFYPFTINSAILTPSGARADSLSALQRPSLDGKINTSTLNFTFSSRPVENLAIKANFRSYELTNKTNRFVVTGDVAASPDRSWNVVTPSADAPYGHATGNVYDNKTTKFTASMAYDFGDLTVEAQGRMGRLERTSREALKGDDNGYALTALYHANDRISFRGTYDDSKRTAEGHTVYGFQNDEAERKTKRTGIDVEFSLPKGVDLTFAYFLRDVEYSNRPDRVPVTSGVPTPGGDRVPEHPERPARSQVRLVHRGDRLRPERAC